VATPIAPVLQGLREGYNRAPTNPFGLGGYSPLKLPGFKEKLNPNPVNPYAGQGYTTMPFSKGPLINTGIDPEFWSGQKNVKVDLPAGFTMTTTPPDNQYGTWVFRAHVPGVHAPNFSPGVIASISVDPTSQRVGSANTAQMFQGRGVGSTLYDYAKKQFPKLQHSTTLSPAGLAFAASTEGYHQGNVYPGVLHTPGDEGWEDEFTSVLRHLYSGKVITADTPFVPSPEGTYQYAIQRWKKLPPGPNPQQAQINAPLRLPPWLMQVVSHDFEPELDEPSPIQRQNLGALRQALVEGYSRRIPPPPPMRPLAQSTDEQTRRDLAQGLNRGLDPRYTPRYGAGTPLGPRGWLYQPPGDVNAQLGSLDRSQLHQIHDAYLRGDISRDQWAAHMRRLGLNPPSA